MNGLVRLILLLPLLAAGTCTHATRTDAATGLEFVDIPAGAFVMGTADLDAVISEQAEPDAGMVRDETPAHRVSIDAAFQLATTEVTQQFWLDIMGTRPGPSAHWQHPRWQQLPVVSISWNRVQDFLERLNARGGSYRYRLPTEAEWEYAARAGVSGLRPGSGLELDEHAWYIHNSHDEVQPVAGLAANAWGLYDMLGNVWEWVSDYYAPTTYQRGAVAAPTGPASGDKRVRRGGSYHCQPRLVRYAYRSADTPDTAYSVIGFRLVRERL